MTKQIKIYIASPLGFSEIGRNFLYSQIIPKIKNIGYEVLNPWELTPQELIQPVANIPYGQERKNKWKELNKIIGKNNADAIKESNGVLAILDGADIDSGTAAEIGYAVALGKPVLGYRGDFRLSADNDGSIINLQVQYFIETSGGKIINKIEDLGKELASIIKI